MDKDTRIDIEQAIKEEAHNYLVKSGKVQELIQKNVEDMMKSILEDVFRSYGNLAKELKEKIQSAIKIDIDQELITQYNVFTVSTVKEYVENFYATEAKTHINNILDEQLREYTQTEFKVSDIIKRFKQTVEEPDPCNCYGNVDYDDGGYYKETTIYLEDHKDKFFYLYLDPDKQDRKYDCKYRLSVHEDKVFNITIDDKELSGKSGIGILRGFEAFLLYLYSAKPKVILDKENIDWEDVNRVYKDSY